jgi:hypothetical protein
MVDAVQVALGCMLSRGGLSDSAKKTVADSNEPVLARRRHRISGSCLPGEKGADDEFPIRVTQIIEPSVEGCIEIPHLVFWTAMYQTQAEGATQL